MKNLIVRTITGVLFVAAVVCSFLDPVAMIALFALVTGLTLKEFCSIVNENIEKVQVNTFISTVAGTYLFLAMSGYVSGMTPSAGVFIPYLVTIIYLFVSELYLKAESPLDNWAYTMLSQMYIALPLSMISVLAFQSINSKGAIDPEASYCFTATPLVVFIFLGINDTGAYCSGSLFGKRKLFPSISPNKSWEGSIGGGLLVLAAAAGIWYFTENCDTAAALSLVIPHLSIVEWLGLGLTVVFFGTWGDLVESLLKRKVGIKDSGNILPGHGGMLDRFDSSLLAMPAVAVYLFTLEILVR